MNRHILIFLFIVCVGGQALALEFKHAEHLQNAPKATCGTCHLENATAIMPDTQICLECHDQEHVDAVTFPSSKTHGPTWALTHRSQAKSEAYDCAVCHEQSDCMACHKAGFGDEMGRFSNHMLNVHGSDFHVTHPIAARTDPQLCAGCHENRYCVDCHNTFNDNDLALLSHRKGWSNLATSPLGPLHSQFDESQCQSCHPNSVLPTHQWSSSHAREARKNLATCQACHPEGDVCMTCHSARSGLRVNPHPADWDKIKDRLDGASGGKTCRKCH